MSKEEELALDPYNTRLAHNRDIVEGELRVAAIDVLNDLLVDLAKKDAPQVEAYIQGITETPPSRFTQITSRTVIQGVDANGSTEELSALTIMLSRKRDEETLYPAGSEQIFIRFPLTDPSVINALREPETLPRFEEIDIEYIRKHPAREFIQRLILNPDSLRVFEFDAKTGTYTDSIDVDILKLTDQDKTVDHEPARAMSKAFSRFIGRSALERPVEAPKASRKIDALQLSELLEAFLISKFPPASE